MEEPKDAEGNSSTESSPIIFLPLQENTQSDLEDLSLPVIDGNSEANHQSRAIKDSEVLEVQDVPHNSSLEQPTTILSEISNGKELHVENIVAVSSELHDIQVPHSLDNSRAGIHLRMAEGRLHAELSRQMEDGSIPDKPLKLTIPSALVGRLNVTRGLVDTAAPIESVKEAVTKFGGIVDWKAHKTLTIERRKHVEFELEKLEEEIPQYKKQSEAAEDAKIQVIQELDRTNKLIEELKLNLERAQTEEAQAKQDSVLAQLRVKEMEQGIANEASMVAKAQLEVAQARYDAAVVELKSVKDELETTRRECASLVKERDTAIGRAEEAVSASKDVEKTVEDLTLELIMARESLESAHAAHLEAEEHRINAALARDQDSFNWEKELKQVEDEMQRLNEQLLVATDLKSKLDTASTLLLNLKGELAAYMEGKLNQESENIEEEEMGGGKKETEVTRMSIQASVASAKKELEEVKLNTEKAKQEINILRVAAMSVSMELEGGKAALAPMRQREGMAAVAVSSLENELNSTKSEIQLVRIKEKEAIEQMEELNKAMQQAAHEADEAKSVAQSAQEELRKAKEEAEQAKASASVMESRLHAILKEIEAAKASESLALAAVEALPRSEQTAGMGGDDFTSGVTLQLEEYYLLSKRAHEAEELASERVATAMSQIEVAKESELRSLDRLEEANREMAEKREALRVATEKDEKAKEGKLGVEQELRKWRAEHERQRKAAASDAAHVAAIPTRGSPPGSFEGDSEPKNFKKDLEAIGLVHPVPDTDKVVPESEGRRKKTFFPRFIMFLARSKARPSK